MSFLANFVQHVISKTSKSETCHFKEDFLSTCQTPYVKIRNQQLAIFLERKEKLYHGIYQTSQSETNCLQTNSCFKNRTSQSEEENIDFLQFVRKHFYHICQTQNFRGRGDFFFYYIWNQFHSDVTRGQPFIVLLFSH